MGICYHVTPLGNYAKRDDEDATRAYYESIGIKLSPGETPGRYPTPREIRGVLDRLEGFSVTYRVDMYYWTASISYTRDPKNGPWTYLHLDINDFSGDEEEPCSFYFEKGWESLIIHIAEQLSQLCGPLIVEDDMEFTPLVITPGIDIQKAVKDWSGSLERWPFVATKDNG